MTKTLLLPKKPKLALRKFVKVGRKLGVDWLKYLCDHGEEFQGRLAVADASAEVKAWVRQRKPQAKFCFPNSQFMAMDVPDLRYFEGYVFTSIPIEHAWVVTAEDKVIDPTLEDADRKTGKSAYTVGCPYFGVEIPMGFVQEMLVRYTMSAMWLPEYVEHLCGK